MPRSQGFAKGDLDTSFPLDDKFQDLRRATTPERYFTATGVYWFVVAATWREGERKSAFKIAPEVPEVVADLIVAGLLDSGGCVTRRAWAHFIVAARARRRTSADRQRAFRERMSRVTNGESQVTNALSGQVRTGHYIQDKSVEGGGAGGGEPRPPTPRQVALAWLLANGYRKPTGWAAPIFSEMLGKAGAEDVVQRFAEGKEAGVLLTNELVGYAEKSMRNGARPGKKGKYLEGSAKELSDAFVRD